MLLLPDIRELHGFSDDEVLEFVASVFSRARRASGTQSVSHLFTRDVTDTKFLALAKETGADYLVTNDRCHLLRLQEFGMTRIVTPAHFLSELADHAD